MNIPQSTLTLEEVLTTLRELHPEFTSQLQTLQEYLIDHPLSIFYERYTKQSLKEDFALEYPNHSEEYQELVNDCVMYLEDSEYVIDMMVMDDIIQTQLKSYAVFPDDDFEHEPNNNELLRVTPNMISWMQKEFHITKIPNHIKNTITHRKFITYQQLSDMLSSKQEI